MQHEPQGRKEGGDRGLELVTSDSAGRPNELRHIRVGEESRKSYACVAHVSGMSHADGASRLTIVLICLNSGVPAARVHSNSAASVVVTTAPAVSRRRSAIW